VALPPLLRGASHALLWGWPQPQLAAGGYKCWWEEQQPLLVEGGQCFGPATMHCCHMCFTCLFGYHACVPLLVEVGHSFPCIPFAVLSHVEIRER
jgi:hypothetical protein